MNGSMDGKVCLVTGATSGIGKETARALAKMGAHVALVGRDARKGAATMREIRESSGNGKIDLLLADLSSRTSIRGLAQEVHDRYPALHVLVNNAGGVFSKRAVTADGIELTFALNHLSYFMLTNLLLDLLKSSAPARIVNVSSNVHQGAHIDFDDLQGQRGYRAFRAYSRSKLANVLFTYELARRLGDTAVTSNCLHPGFVASGFGKNNSGPMKVAISLLTRTPLAIGPEKGAQTSVYLASSPEVEGITGKYFVKCMPKRSTKESYDEEIARRLWDVSARMTGIQTPATMPAS